MEAGKVLSGFKALEYLRTLPAAAPANAICEYFLCHAPIAHLRAGTRFCSAACKMKAARASKKS